MVDCSLLFVIIEQVDDDPRDFTEEMVVENRSDVRKNIEFTKKSQFRSVFSLPIEIQFSLNTSFYDEFHAIFQHFKSLASHKYNSFFLICNSLRPNVLVATLS